MSATSQTPLEESNSNQLQEENDYSAAFNEADQGADDKEGCSKAYADTFYSDEAENQAIVEAYEDIKSTSADACKADLDASTLIKYANYVESPVTLVQMLLLWFYAPSTAKGIWRRDLGFKSHLKDWRSQGSNSRPLVYKVSSFTTKPQRLLYSVTQLTMSPFLMAEKMHFNAKS